MSLKTAAILDYYGNKDFSLWTVELPEAQLEEIRRTAPTIAGGDLYEVMSKIPKRRKTDDYRMHFLFREWGGFALRTKDMGPEFLEEYQDEGGSVRGSKKEIVAEVLEHFQIQQPTQIMLQ